MLVTLGTAPAWAATQAPARPPAPDRRVAARIRALEDEADRIAAQARAVVDAIETLQREHDRHLADAARAEQQARALELELIAARQHLEKLRQVDAMDEPLIASRLVQVYKQGRGGYARLLLGAGTLQDIGRAARTLSSLVDQNAARITARLDDIAEAERQEAALTAQLNDLVTTGGRSRDAAAEAMTAIAEREATASQLDRKRDANAQMLGELRGATPGAFAAFRGALDWPVVGPVATRFGPGRRQAGALANGITISAPPGTPVVAVHAGVVTYAEPLAGFGTLVMLDHGGGFTSAYGLLRSTTARRDQQVAQGEQLGVVGDAVTPGARTAMYFEVRSAGRPADPLQWLRPR